MTLQCPACEGVRVLVPAAPCPHCGHRLEVVDGVVNLDPAPTESGALAGSYADNYDRIAEDDLASPILDLDYVQRQAANMVRYAGKVDGCDVLDLGCGQGFLSRALVQAGARQVIAADISMAYLRRLVGVPGVVPVRANAETLPFVDACDVLVSTDVMEHVINLGSCLASMNKALRLGGRAIVRVPYRESLLPYSRQAGCKYEYVHLRAFDAPLLKRTLADAGFKADRVRYDGFSIYSPQPFWWSGKRRKKMYTAFQKWTLARVSSAAEVTNWPWQAAILWMRANEVVVSARKIRQV